MVLYKYKDKQEGEQMRTNKTISIDIDVLKEMLEYCNKYNVTFSRLIVVLWEFFKKKNTNSK
jgi:hypothetical protein